MEKRQLALLKCLYRKPRTVKWIKSKFKVSSLRDICAGIFPYIETTDGHHRDDCVVSLSRQGITEVESHQWFSAKFVVLQILLPIAIAVITTLLTIFLTRAL